MVALAAVATSTSSPRHRTAALDFARAGMARFSPSSAGADWKIGVLAEGLMSVHALTGDTAVEAWLRRYGETLLGAPPEAERDPRPGVVLGYLAVLTGDERYRRAALAQAAATEIGTWGKPIAVRGRVGFRLLAPLAGGAAGPS
jgi:rhamnogalacturonyl hydrolase YesR